MRPPPQICTVFARKAPEARGDRHHVAALPFAASAIFVGPLGFEVRASDARLKAWTDGHLQSLTLDASSGEQADLEQTLITRVASKAADETDPAFAPL
jgi:hypothetical protein